jgi:hypothetical protein
MKIRWRFEAGSDAHEFGESEAREFESVSQIFASKPFKFVQIIQKFRLRISPVLAARAFINCCRTVSGEAACAEAHVLQASLRLTKRISKFWVDAHTLPKSNLLREIETRAVSSFIVHDIIRWEDIWSRKQTAGMAICRTCWGEGRRYRIQTAPKLMDR